MKYPLSHLKHKLNELGVFGLSFLNAVNNNYTNSLDLHAKQWVRGTEIFHKIEALTFEDALTVLVARAKRFKALLEEITPVPYEQPDTGKRNMVGHIADGNFELAKDIVFREEICPTRRSS